jgi:hypothetical protein
MEQDNSAPTWRQLPFYELTKVRDAADFTQTPEIFRSPTSITAIASILLDEKLTEGGGKASKNDVASPEVSQTHVYILVGRSDGQIVVCEPDNYASLTSWYAFQGSGQGSGAESSSHSGRVTHLATDLHGRVVSLGEDYGARFPILRIWDLNARTNGSGNSFSPRLLAEAKIQHGSQPFPVASLALTSGSRFLAVGLGDGTVLLLRNLNEALSSALKTREAANASAAAVALPKFKVIHQASSKPGETGYMDTITGLGFAEDAQDRHEQPNGTTKEERRTKSGAAYKPRIRGAAKQEDRASAAMDTVNLYIVTLTKTLRYAIIGKAAGSPASLLDDVGCALDCACVILRSRTSVSSLDVTLGSVSSLVGKMVVAREDAVYAIGLEGREISLAFEGKKSAIRLLGSQMVIVSPPLDATAASGSATVRKYVAGKDRHEKLNGTQGFAHRSREVAKVTVFDLEGKFVAYSGTVESGVRNVWTDPQGSILVLADDGELFRLDEKPLRQKLDILYRKSLFQLAIGVALSHAERRKVGNAASLLADIHRRYGDALYEKGDFEGSISQFVKTIGITQPSYVIRKFLDAQRITNLTIYLQELHEKGFANSDHTTLLLNCFAKLKDVASLDKFIKRPVVRTQASNDDADINELDSLEREGEGNQDDLPFDLDTAIRVCRQGGYFEHAAYLAGRYGQLDEYIRIQVEDTSDCKAAMQHIRGLALADAERNLIRYGRRLLEEDADATTDLLIEICSGVFAPVPVATGTGVDAAKVEAKSRYLDYINPSKLRKNTLDDNVAVGAIQPTSPALDQDLQPAKESVAPAAKPPSPRTFFSQFLTHPTQFTRFLETIALARWNQKIEETQADADLPSITDLSDGEEDPDDDREERRMIWNTLFEIYLVESKRKPANSNTLEERALSLLKQHSSLDYDISRALITCQQHAFTAGTILLYERLGMYEDIVRLQIENEQHYDDVNDEAMATKEGQQLLSALERYATVQPNLYVMVLRHLVATQRLVERHEKDVERILSHIFDEALLSPLEVVQMLSKKGVATIGLLRKHLMRTLDDQQADIATNASLTRNYREETRTKQAEIEVLQDVNQPRIFQQSRCSACSGMLDLPSIHFMCRHSFHSRCLAEAENECPMCAQSHGVILEIRRNNMQFGRRHDLFIEEVRDADDGFDTIASMFSKGLFDAQQLGEERK